MKNTTEKTTRLFKIESDLPLAGNFEKSSPAKEDVFGRAFVAGLQQARIDALDTALVKLVLAGDELLEYWQHGTPVHAGSDVAADFKAAMDAAHRTLA